MAKMQGARHAVCPSCLVPCGWKGPAFPVANWKHIWPRAHSHTPSGGSSISAARHLTSSRPGEICEFLGPPWKPPRTPPRKTPRETPRESTRDTARVHGRLRTGNRLPPPRKPYVFNLVFELYINFSELYIKFPGKFRDFRGNRTGSRGKVCERENTPLNSTRLTDSTKKNDSEYLIILGGLVDSWRWNQ